MGAGVLVYFAVNQRKTPEGPTNIVLSPVEIEARLADLQQQFQTALQEKEDLTRLRSAIKLFTKEAPDEPAGHVLLAQIRMASNRWSGAYEALAQALELDPQAYELCKMAGFCAARLGHVEQAKIHYTAAVNVSDQRPDNEVYTSLGRLNLALSDDLAAEQAFEQSIRAPAPGGKTNWKHESYAGLADVASYRKLHDKAHEWVDRAIKHAKLDSSADLVGYQIQKARLFADADRPDDALAMLTHTWQTYPDSQRRIESARLRARLYEQAQELGKAVNHIAYVTDTHQRDPDRKDATLADFYALLAAWQIKAKQTDAARIAVQNLATLAPEHPALVKLRSDLP